MPHFVDMPHHGQLAAFHGMVPCIGKATRRCLKHAVSCVADEKGHAHTHANGGVSKAGLVRGAQRELAAALCRGTPLMYRVSMFQLARTAGRGSARPGLLVPTADHD
jgi:hypothetical protein